MTRWNEIESKISGEPRMCRFTVLNRVYYEVSVNGRTHVRKSPKAAAALANLPVGALREEDERQKKGVEELKAGLAWQGGVI